MIPLARGGKGTERNTSIPWASRALALQPVELQHTQTLRRFACRHAKPMRHQPVACGRRQGREGQGGGMGMSGHKRTWCYWLHTSVKFKTLLRSLENRLPSSGASPPRSCSAAAVGGTQSGQHFKEGRVASPDVQHISLGGQRTASLSLIPSLSSQNFIPSPIHSKRSGLHNHQAEAMGFRNTEENGIQVLRSAQGKSSAGV